jgi:hypothetical protein
MDSLSTYTHLLVGGLEHSRGLNTFQLVRPSQLSVEGYVPRFRHGNDPGDLSGLGRCGLCFLP